MATADIPDQDQDRLPAESTRTREPEVNKLFRMVMKHEASDLHLKVGQPPMMRLRGDIRRVDMRPLTQEDMERLLLPCLDARQRRILDEEGGVDFSYVVGNDECRFRVSLFRQRGSYFLPDLLADIDGGHNIVSTVFLECQAMYRKDGPPEMAPVDKAQNSFAKFQGHIDVNTVFSAIGPCEQLGGVCEPK